jgi:hypothetical protein
MRILSLKTSATDKEKNDDVCKKVTIARIFGSLSCTVLYLNTNINKFDYTKMNRFLPDRFKGGTRVQQSRRYRRLHSQRKRDNKLFGTLFLEVKVV